MQTVLCQTHNSRLQEQHPDLGSVSEGTVCAIPRSGWAMVLNRTATRPERHRMTTTSNSLLTEMTSSLPNHKDHTMTNYDVATESSC